MRRNNGFLSFFIFLIFLTYVFYLTYGFFKQRKETTNNIVSKMKIRRDDFYQSSEKASDTADKQTAEPQAAEQPEKDEADKTAEENPKADNPEEKPAEDRPKEAKPSETPKPKEENTETKTKSYIRVATYNKKTDADEALKKLDGDFRIRSSKTSSGKEVYILISKTVSSNEELEKLKGKVKNYSYQIINQK